MAAKKTAAKASSKKDEAKTEKSALELMMGIEKEKNVRHIELRSIEPTDYLSLGCLSADLIMGGGTLGNEVTQIFGPAGVGKSTLGYLATGGVVRQHVPTQMHDYEGTTKKDYRERLAKVKPADAKFFRYVRPQHGVEGYDMIQSLLKQLPDRDEGLPQVCFLVDSVAMMPTEREMRDWTESKQLAQRASMHSEWWPRIKGLLARKHVSMVAINQIKSNPGPFGGIVRPGGNAWEFNTDNLIQVLGGKPVEVNGEVYQSMRFKSWKNKHYKSQQECEVFLRLGYGIDPASDVIEFLKLSGHLKTVKVGKVNAPVVSGLDAFSDGAKLDGQYKHVNALTALIREQAEADEDGGGAFSRACRALLLSGQAIRDYEAEKKRKGINDDADPKSQAKKLKADKKADAAAPDDDDEEEEAPEEEASAETAPAATEEAPAQAAPQEETTDAEDEKAVAKLKKKRNKT